jgi:hypothetical protein
MLHAEGESLSAVRDGVSAYVRFCLCSRGPEDDSSAQETSGVVCFGHGEGCGRGDGDGEGGGEEGGGEEHEDEAEDGGEEERGLGEHVGWFDVVVMNVH